MFRLTGVMKMTEYIKREELLQHYEEYYCKPCREKGDDYHGVRCRAFGTGDAIETAEDIQSADVRKNIHARWKNTAIGNWACSYCCGESYYGGSINDYKFCPFCGADMRGENND